MWTSIKKVTKAVSRRINTTFHAWWSLQQFLEMSYSFKVHD